jgi:hypothetical protein
MKKIVVLILIFGIFATGCGGNNEFSEAEIADEIKGSLQTQIDEKLDSGKVKDVQCAKKDSGDARCFADVEIEDEEEQVSINVTEGVDGYIWEVDE